MFLEKPYIVGAIALSDALVMHVAKQTVLAELERNPGFARRVIALLAAKLHANAREFELHALGSGAQRFAAWLLRAAPADAEGAVSLALPATKKALASQLNLSAEHLSRILRRLARQRLVEVQGRRVRIPDVDRLRDWVGTVP
jgi:CRP-like cAMP-binding protein